MGEGVMDMSGTPKILKNKIFLYLTEFFAGMSVMAVELGAGSLHPISALPRSCGRSLSGRS